MMRLSTGSPFEAEMAYSRAVVKGPFCFVAGVTGYDYATMTLPEGVADQARNCFATIADVLGRCGFAMDDIVRVTYFVPRPEDIPALAPVLRSALGGVLPAATMVQAGLIRPEMRIEIEVTAMKG